MRKKRIISDDLSFKAFIKGIAQAFFHLDRGLPKTLAVLVTKPGRLSTAYFQLPKQNYIQPLKLYFAINFLFFLLTPILNTPKFQVFNFSMQSLISSNPVYQKLIEKEVQASAVSRAIYEERFNAHLKYNQPAFVFLIIPFFALVLQVMHFRKKRYYIEHLVFALHYLSFFLLFLLLIISLFRIAVLVLGAFAISSDVAGIILVVGLFLGLLLYVGAAAKRFYRGRLWTNAAKSVALFAGFILTMAGYVQFLFFYTLFAVRFGS